MLKKVPGKILVVKPSSLGDIVHALPVLATLRKTFPQATIDWVVAKGFEGLLEQHPMINRLWIIHKDRWKNLRSMGTTVGELRTLARSLRSEQYDLVIDLQGLLRSGLITQATKAPVRIGFSEAREGSRLFYTHAITGGRDVHAVDRYLAIARAIGCDVSSVTFPFPSGRDSETIRQIKADVQEYAVLVPGARWETKRWPPERFAKLAAALPAKSLVIGSKADAGIGMFIEQHSHGNARSLAGKTTLPELISIIRSARFVVTNDSGPMHIAAALDIPTIALFGPTNPIRTGPYGSRNVVLTPKIACAPCYKKQCPAPKCMEELTKAQVLGALRSVGAIPQ